MNKEKIVEELNEWAKKEFGSDFWVDDDNDDLTLFAARQFIAWFEDFKECSFSFRSTSDYDLNVKLIKEGIIEKFYDKAIELMSEYEPKYTVQVLPNEYGFLYKRDNDLNDVVADDLSNDPLFPAQWGYFTQSEIDELKKRDDVAVDWDKAVIKEVND